MAEPMETSESDVSFDEEYEELKVFNEKKHNAVLATIHKYCIDDKYCDVTLETIIDKKRYVIIASSLASLKA